MDRCSFLLAGAASLSVARAQAQMQHMRMPGGGMRAMMGGARDVVPLPEDAPFRELPQLSNQATAALT
ncbi:MAG: hypothetical protein KGQ37_05115 [Hyphomicrobiales bacterium]|nr:hypothetical protein [Hyphomicrobiales bacterium]